MLTGTLISFNGDNNHSRPLLISVDIVVKVSTSVLFRNIIAVVAIIGGLINLRSYIKSRKEEDGCDVVDDKKRKKIFTKIKKYVIS